jgi:xanthosine utilization system XapX-like protein
LLLALGRWLALLALGRGLALGRWLALLALGGPCPSIQVFHGIIVHLLQFFESLCSVHVILG